MLQRRLVVALSVLFLAGGWLATLAGVAAQEATPAGEPVKVAFVYVGPIGDLGWTYAHDQGRLALEEALPNVETAYQESVPENPADAERVIRDFAQEGNKVIFTTSFGYMDPTINVAKDFPDTVFIHISGYKTAENVGTGFGKIEEPRYVSGLIAGQDDRPRTQIGYVAAFPIPEVIRGINAFTLGVRKANPDGDRQGRLDQHLVRSAEGAAGGRGAARRRRRRHRPAPGHRRPAAGGRGARQVRRRLQLRHGRRRRRRRC